MRRILFLGLTLAMSAFLFTNCAFQDWEPQPSENNGDVGGNTPGEKTDVPFEIAASIVQTKTANNDGELVWAAGDRLNAFHTVSSTTAIVNDGEVTLADAGKGLFEGTLAKGLKDGYAYDWYLFYPYTENLTIYENAAEITIGAAAGSAQRQAGNDSKAHLAGTAMPLFGAATGVEAGKTPAAQMHHLASIVEVVVTNGVTPPLKVSEVAVTANEAIVGTFGLDLSTSTLTYNPASTSNTAKLAVDGAAELAHGESAKFYIAVKPFSATPGTGIKLSVNGYEKVIRKLPFEAETELDGIELGADSSSRASGYITDLSVNVEEGRAAIEANLVLEACVAYNKDVSYSADAYSTEQKSQCFTKNCAIPKALLNKNASLSLGERIALEELGIPEGAELADVSASAVIDNASLGDGKYLLRGSCRYCFIFKKDGEYAYAEAKLPIRYECDAQGEICDISSYDALAEIISCRGRCDGESVSVDSELALAVSLFGSNDATVLEKVELGEKQEKRRGVFAVCYPTREDTLWSVAKRYAVEPSAISGDPESDSFVMIEM